jgi:hypothetical protein
MPKNEEVGGSLGDGASSLRMSQFIEALIRVDLNKQKALELDKGVSVGIFGWCLTGHHELCYKKIPFQVCTCTCHIEEDGAQSE